TRPPGRHTPDRERPHRAAKPYRREYRLPTHYHVHPTSDPGGGREVSPRWRFGVARRSSRHDLRCFLLRRYRRQSERLGLGGLELSAGQPEIGLAGPRSAGCDFAAVRWRCGGETKIAPLIVVVGRR